MLHNFGQHAQLRGETHVPRASALAWAAEASTVRQRARRLAALIDLAKFLYAEDSRHEIPPRPLVCPNPRRPLPHILSTEQIRQLIQAASQLGPRGSLRPFTFYALLGLLAVTGLRISEALELRIDDFTCDGLIVRETKFRKYAACSATSV
jgi:integrase